MCAFSLGSIQETFDPLIEWFIHLLMYAVSWLLFPSSHVKITFQFNSPTASCFLSTTATCLVVYQILVFQND